MSEQTLDYFTCVMSVLNDDGLLLSKQIDTSDSTYASWKAGTLSPRDYLKYCISKQWIDITKLDVDQKYADSSEIYTALCSYIRDAMTDNKDFAKIIYKYMVNSGAVTGQQLCLLLFDQGVLDYDDATVSNIANGSISPYAFLMDKINNIEITPAQLALDPCTGSCVITDVKTLKGKGMDAVISALTRLLPEDFGQEFILGDLVCETDLVLLVMPQDIQAPKGRLILPQVQTLRELLDRKCLVMSTTTDKMTDALAALSHAPKLIVTDSQVFGYVYEHKPAESMLTSFSVLFAAYKGDLPYYVESARAIDALKPSSRVLIAECCTHAPLAEDIGRVKLPNLLRKRVGEELTVDITSGTDFPDNLSQYDLVIQCGACMFNRKYVLSRIDRARTQHVPMTNYGVAIAHLTGILDKVSMP